MIDLNNMKHIQLKSGRVVPRYRCTCDACGCEKGYIDKNAGLKHGKCRKCANTLIAEKIHKGKVVSKETREKMSLTSYARYNDKDWVSKKDTERKPRQYKTWNTPEQKKIKHNIKTLLNQKLKRRGLTKDGNRTFELLGYKPEELICHLESKFQHGMSWGNYGEWHIDHINPDSWFNYMSTNDVEFKSSWALSNLQPLWARDNLSKGNRYNK